MKIVHPKTGEEKPVIISEDDGIRPETNMQSLAKLRPAFAKDGSTTAGILIMTCLWNLLEQSLNWPFLHILNLN